ncbi:phosphoenolpyruvate synthase [Chitinophaga sancti]|uniref:phosphoenolpyruvate synthase n=1 Tax=Chitinophaga sancti TaxID=1004 RepID=UPI003F7B0161
MILDFREIDHTKLSLAGGKGANLGELLKIDGIQVPEGFCITTDVYQEIIKDVAIQIDKDNIPASCARIRAAIEAQPVPGEIVAVIAKLEDLTYAVRSSATAEDLPNTSFAGQQDTYLNVRKQDITQYIRKCWASLFTERAVVYREQHGFDHSKVLLAVVIQKMIFPEVAGIMFTADPVNGDRRVVAIDASFGLGEALVGGLVNADHYKVKRNEIIDRNIGGKHLQVVASKEGGTIQQEIPKERQNSPVLTDNECRALNELGRKIEAHFDQPQDIEWCLANGVFYMLQSRPITTLFPIPSANDSDNHVYLSVGHNQMMTDAMKPLGLSFFLMTTPARMCTAGGRLFIDVAQQLSQPASREMLIGTFGRYDPLFRDALITIVEREGYIKPTGDTIPTRPQLKVENDPAIVADLMKTTLASIEALKQNIQAQKGVDLFDFIQNDLQALKNNLSNQQSLAVIMAGMEASAWVNEKMFEWLGEKGVADIISQSVPDNITSEMGLALLDVADAIRPFPEVIAFLQAEHGEHFLNELKAINEKAWQAIADFLDRYGMRCVGEIDITKTRWREQPGMLAPLILSNTRNFAPGESKRKFEKGRIEAEHKEKELLARLHEEQAAETKEKISLIRNFIGYREFPKYTKICRYDIYKQAILKEVEELVQSNIIHEKEDIFYLTFDELRELVRTHQLDEQLIDQRKAEFKVFEKMTPPRVMTSDGEIISSTYDRAGLPAHALAGLAVSAGVIEGRARVILNMEDASLEEGDILVTTFTDPSWTPLFVAVKGLVTEIGGLMTHGAVIAREYGLPAVVGVANATKIIRDGMRIRVNGTDGYVEVIV